MNTSEQVGELFAALVTAQSDIGSVEHDCVVDYTFKGKRTHFQYTSLKKLLETVKPALKKANLAILQSPKADDTTVTLVTRLVHASGQWIEDELSMKAASNGPHDIAGVITYAKRYSISSMLGVACGEDNDANEVDSIYTATDEQKVYLSESLGGSVDKETMIKISEIMTQRGMPCRQDAIMSVFDEVSRGV
jgi:hypothetical protein